MEKYGEKDGTHLVPARKHHPGREFDELLGRRLHSDVGTVDAELEHAVFVDLLGKAQSCLAGQVDHVVEEVVAQSFLGRGCQKNKTILAGVVTMDMKS
jgi:hypothetical protein